ncbi:MAG TPA: peptidoglycan-binding domain-containing protein [Candidatus Hydrogenedentes bacterium]|nr:peptidoglycan-binding domain-containing protein [Candidatus Hydrogenedentota bacterium]
MARSGLPVYAVVLVALVGVLTSLGAVQAQGWAERQQIKSIERAEYWRSQGFTFNPERMTPYMMDQKVKDIQRAKYWQEKGYDFDPDHMTAYMMDQKVKDIQRAEYWRSQGYTFSPARMTAYMMDQKVKDIQRAKYWQEKGYDFDPDRMTAYMMNQKVKDIERAEYWKKRGHSFDPQRMTAYQMDQAASLSGANNISPRSGSRSSAPSPTTSKTPAGGTIRPNLIPDIKNYYEATFRDEDIITLRSVLAGLGYPVKQRETEWGPDAHEATCALQRSLGVVVDGKIGQNTLDALSRACSIAPPEPITAYAPKGTSETRVWEPNSEVRLATPMDPLLNTEEELDDEDDWGLLPPNSPGTNNSYTGLNEASGSWTHRSDDSSRFVFHSGTASDGTSISGTTIKIGRFRFHDFSDSEGNSAYGSSHRIGRFDFHDISTSDGESISGTSTDIGRFRFHDFSSSDGTSMSGTSTKIGNFEFHDFTDSNGNYVSGTTTRIGDHSFTDWNE